MKVLLDKKMPVAQADRELRRRGARLVSRVTGRNVYALDGGAQATVTSAGAGLVGVRIEAPPGCRCT